ncbi:MAG: phenylalanine--tRNA ligase subunit alpha [Deltaproteobacteria bacterium]|nr:phenylalanine--tRNA ligase subunit alpha [Deltaproteobacteria bacterium]
MGTPDATPASRLKAVTEQGLAEIASAGSVAALQEIDTRYLGRKKGLVSDVLATLRNVPDAERAELGKAANAAKEQLTAAMEARRRELYSAELDQKLAAESLDITLPSRGVPLGRMHPVSQMEREVRDILLRMGFSVVDGPEVELDYYNFEALNFPADHPARDMQDTFYVAPGVVLRTHTSPVQIRAMLKRKPPVKVICTGRVYRCDSDQTHSPMFHQMEVLWIDEQITFADLKGVLRAFIRELFGPEQEVRLRPSFFPFTEPSAEVDIQCVFCGGKGCGVCKHTGWLEVLGAGMVDPNVLKAVNYDPEKVQGFAFGTGIERLAMLKYRIPDLRLFFENDVRFLGRY